VHHRSRLVALVATLVIASLAPASVAQGAGARRCAHDIFVRNRLAAVATVLSVRGTSCRGARKVVRRHGRSAGRGAFRRGGRFRLGAWRCRNYLVIEEDFRARCALRKAAFRVDYGA
jgi:hypothetical protein